MIIKANLGSALGSWGRELIEVEITKDEIELSVAKWDYDGAVITLTHKQLHMLTEMVKKLSLELAD